MTGECLPCGGGKRVSTGTKQLSGGARGGIAMRRQSAVARTWVITCPDGQTQEVVGDTAAYQAAASCGGSYTIKT